MCRLREYLRPFTPLNHGTLIHSSVERGDRVAQLILERIYLPEVQEVAELDDTARGGGGFGSTGVQGVPPAADVSGTPRSPTGEKESEA